ncbi:DUF3887 domain-containing protein [Rhodanobacter sp. DHB23]|uniref:DUF3887 domain-containing protein n=1 Tax=Rhodanobacter sp. DHB23 TaxID=2775923 RepID=UPI00177F2458|nr:DUF3887 domain-containing protein [Rhodanobacter sp. DHB23]MBD8874022.1 DUF3887 domain-containing protein [Rhodanobacter sp. DHB23]
MKQAMHFIFPAMLMAFGSAHAQQMAPAPQSPQPRPSQQEPPPSPQQSQQEQTAISAAQMKSCGGVANKAITAMNKGDFDGAKQAFDPKLSPTTDKLQQAWGSLTKQYGNAKSIGDAGKGQMMQGDVVVLVPMQFEKGQVGAEAACSPAGQLVMLRFGLMPNDAASKS